MAPMPCVCYKFHGTHIVTPIWEFFLQIQFSDFLICRQICCYQSKNIIYCLWNPVDPGMSHQSVPLIFLLGVTTYETGLAFLCYTLMVHFTSSAQLFHLGVSTNGNLY